MDISCQEEIAGLLFGSSNSGLTLENVGKVAFVFRDFVFSAIRRTFSNQARLSAVVLVANHSLNWGLLSKVFL